MNFRFKTNVYEEKFYIGTKNITEIKLMGIDPKRATFCREGAISEPTFLSISEEKIRVVPCYKFFDGEKELNELKLKIKNCDDNRNLHYLAGAIIDFDREKDLSEELSRLFDGKFIQEKEEGRETLRYDFYFKDISGSKDGKTFKKYVFAMLKRIRKGDAKIREKWAENGRKQTKKEGIK